MAPVPESHPLKPLAWVAVLGVLLAGAVAALEILGGEPVPEAEPPRALAPPPPRPAGDRSPPGVEPPWTPPAPVAGRVILGVVRDADSGAGVPDAWVRLDAPGAPREPVARTDSAGQFEVVGAPAVARIRAGADGYLAGEIALSAGGSDTVTVRLTRTSLLKVRVVRQDGTVVPGAGVDLSPPSPPKRDRANQAGEARFGDLKPNRYQVAARSPDGTEAGALDVPLAARQHLLATVTLAPAAMVSGVVMEADGSAGSGAQVWVTSADGLMLGAGQAADNGSFRLPGLAAAEEATVHAVRSARHGRSATIQLRRGGTVEGVVINLAKGVNAIGGVVMDDDGAPASGATVTLAPSHHDGVVSASAVTEGDGRFLFENVGDNHYDVTATQGELEAVLDDVRPGNRAVFLQLSGRAMIEGRVVDESGAPVAAFHARAAFLRDHLARREGGTVRRGQDRSTTVSNPGGRFSVGPFRPGRYEVEVRTEDGRVGRGEVDLPGRLSVDAGDITVRGGGTVTGRVVSRRDGTAVTGAQVRTWARAAEPVVTGSDGRFTVLVGAGNVGLRVTHPGYFDKQVSAGQVQAGATVDVGDVTLVAGSRREIEGRSGFGGVGAVLREEGGRVVVDRLLGDSPAARAGIQRGDVILGVDGDELTGRGVQEAVSILRGESGTTVRVRVRRGSTESDVVIRREPVDTGR